MEAGGFSLASDKFISHLKVITALLVSLNGKSIKRQTQINPERRKPRLSRFPLTHFAHADEIFAHKECLGINCWASELSTNTY